MNRSQEEFDSISRAIKKELERFELERVRDFKSAFIAYLEAQMKAQDKVSFLLRFSSSSSLFMAKTGRAAVSWGRTGRSDNKLQSA